MLQFLDLSLTFSSCITPPRFCTFICHTHFTCCLIQHTVYLFSPTWFLPLHFFVPAVSVLLYHLIFPACKLVFLAFYSKRPCNCFCVLGTSCACPHYFSHITSFNPLTLQRVVSLFETQY